MLGARLVRAVHHALIVAFVVGSMVALSAQSVLDPRYVEFAASPDHNRLASDGTPLVTRYYLSIYPQGSTTAFATVDLGKPAPNASSVIRVDFLALLTVAPTPGVTYEGRVTAIGPGGANASASSNSFGYSLACAPTISPASRSIPQSSTTGSVAVSAATGCGWTAVSNASWITITGGSSGSGSGTVSYSVADNTVATSRTGTMTIAGQTFTITQAAAGCTYSVTPTSESSPAAGESVTASVTAPAGCPWTASSGASWITVASGASGTGNGSVAFTVAANGSSTQRSGALTIAGQALTVTQSGVGCSYSISPVSASVGAAGGSSSTTVTTPAGCAWTAASAASWLTVTGGASGSGTGSVTFSAASNTSTQPRSGTLSVAGQIYTVNQAAAACSYALSPASITVPAAAGTGSTSVNTTAGCTWSTTSNVSWITVGAGGAGDGSGTATFSVAANTSSVSRSGSVTIAGRTLAVSQSGSSCTYSLTPTALSLPATAGTGSTVLTTGSQCSWTARASNNWITVNSTAGSGGATVTYSVRANTSANARTGTVTIGSQVHTISQSGSAPPNNPQRLRISSGSGN